jgi:NAD(P)-dependent dehydrogenase (short-subunit alcohol dehydrogenase family)
LIRGGIGSRILDMRRGRWPLGGKVILITGGARGIGFETARELARRGAVPVLADVDEPALAEAAARLGGDVQTVLVDVTDYGACEAAVAAVVDRHGRLDGVWANAGVAAMGPVELVEPDVWRRVIEVNLLGAYNTVRAALPAVIEARGHVAITASLASFGHAPGLSAYCATKAGVEAFADSLRVEVAHQGVSVSVLHPTWIGTDMVRDGDDASAAFARLRQSLRGPLAKTYPVESVVAPIADGFERRMPRIFLPGFVRIVYRLRNQANAGPFLHETLKIAPELRRLFDRQAKDEGGRAAAFGPRWGR